MTNRRTFLKEAAAFSGAAMIGRAATDWKKQIGLQIYTVRDLLEKDYEGTIAKVAEIGYKEVEPTGYGNLEPKQYRALLDRYGLRAPSTHAGATAGPNLEKELEGHRIMGFQYTQIRGGAPRPPAADAAPAGGRQRPTAESVKRSAEQYNRNGAIAKKFGMKVLIHNHTEEFDLFEDGKGRPYDILLAETDPNLVAMQLDVGWASVAGENILQMFQKNPGRYELWHVKDATGIKNVDPKATPAERRKLARLVPVGQGEVDYKAIFAKADLAGLKHFYIEQDNAAQGGDSLAAARTSYQNLIKMLS